MKLRVVGFMAIPVEMQSRFGLNFLIIYCCIVETIDPVQRIFPMVSKASDQCVQKTELHMQFQANMPVLPTLELRSSANTYESVRYYSLRVGPVF